MANQLWYCDIVIPSRHLANYSHLRPAQRRVLAGDRSEWTEDTEISAAKNMARYLDEASQQHYGSLQNNQPVSRRLIRTCQCCVGGLLWLVWTGTPLPARLRLRLRRKQMLELIRRDNSRGSSYSPSLHLAPGPGWIRRIIRETDTGVWTLAAVCYLIISHHHPLMWII